MQEKIKNLNLLKTKRKRLREWNRNEILQFHVCSAVRVKTESPWSYLVKKFIPTRTHSQVLTREKNNLSFLNEFNLKFWKENKKVNFDCENKANSTNSDSHLTRYDKYVESVFTYVKKYIPVYLDYEFSNMNQDHRPTFKKIKNYLFSIDKEYIHNTKIGTNIGEKNILIEINVGLLDGIEAVNNSNISNDDKSKIIRIDYDNIVKFLLNKISDDEEELNYTYSTEG
jgi:hypothetical protein